MGAAATVHPSAPGRLSASGALFLGLLLGWCAWVLCSVAWGTGGLRAAAPYLVFGIALAAGVAVGRRLRGRTARRVSPFVLATMGGIAFTAVPFYANAQAAWGVQLLAVAGLLASVLLRAVPVGRRRRGRWLGPGALAVVAALLVARSQTASVLVIPVVLLTLYALFQMPTARRWVLGLAGSGAMVAAAASVLVLTVLPAWPAPLNADGGLSSIRHRLWADALELWCAHPILGAGAGSFVRHSALAASTPDLHRAHSSIFQVGAELGGVGVILLFGMLFSGTVIALQGSKQAGLIAVAAWSALGVHSMIDHLYEFPIVAVTAGLALGWASATSEEDDAPSGAAAP